jgi:hypothetical protein
VIFAPEHFALQRADVTHLPLPHLLATNRATASFTPVSTFADLMPDG